MSHQKHTEVVVPPDCQDAGLASTHQNIIYPRHLSSLRKDREESSDVLRRLDAAHSVPQWVAGRQSVIDRYELELREEAKRIQEKQDYDEKVKASKELADAKKKAGIVFDSWRKSKLEEMTKAVDSVKARAASLLPEGMRGLLLTDGGGGGKGGKRKKRRKARPGDALPLGGLEEYLPEGVQDLLAQMKLVPEQGDEGAEEGRRKSVMMAVGAWEEEEVGEDASPPGYCATCGGEEFLCAHCDFVRCARCELEMYPILQLGALVCDRCYVWYMHKPKLWKPPPAPPALPAVPGLGQLSSGLLSIKEPVAWGAALLSFAAPRAAAERDAAAGAVEVARAGGADPSAAAAEEEELVPGTCGVCGDGREYLCPHCDTIYCPNCNFEMVIAKPIGAILCERCYLVWKELGGPSSAVSGGGDGPARCSTPFPPPVPTFPPNLAVAPT